MTPRIANHASDQGHPARDAQVDPLGFVERVDRFFDPWLTSTDRGLDIIARDQLEMVDRYSRDGEKPRQRARKKDDADRVSKIILTVLANFAAAYHAGEPRLVMNVLLGAKRGKSSRYDPSGFGQLPEVLKALDLSGVLILRKSPGFGIASQIEARPALITALKRVSRFAIIQRGDFQTIILSHVEKDYTRNRRKTEWIDYTDTEEIARFRAEMERINSHLKAARLSFEADGGGAVDLRQVHLSRIFNQRDLKAEHLFNEGGRLYHGWWQDLEKSRRRSIRIQGQPIADLDFVSMFPRLAYLEMGEKDLPLGDFYTMIPDLGERQWRDGVKQVVNALLCREGEMTRLPKDCAANLPAKMNAAKVRTRILAAHPVLEGAIERGLGFKLMNTESRILIAALLSLIEQKVTALPMHDGLMVAESKAGLAHEAMRNAALEIVGYDLPIIRK